jgi:hypothetical protein
MSGISITATAGSATANSFVTEAEAIAYMATRLNVTGWVTVSGSSCTEDEKKALIEATREISVLPFIAQRTDDVQVLSWPRTYALDPDAPSITGIQEIAQLYFDDDEIPLRVKNATCELALQFLKSGTTDLAVADPNAGVIEKTVDVLTTRWQNYQRPTGLARFARVMNEIGPLLSNALSGLDVVRV